MSGTSYGACVLHVAPESHVGGPLALVRDGDMIELDVAARRIDMLVSDDELARRRAAWKPPAPKFTRGYGVLFSSTSSRPTRAATSISWRPRRPRPRRAASPKSTDFVAEAADAGALALCAGVAGVARVAGVAGVAGDAPMPVVGSDGVARVAGIAGMAGVAGVAALSLPRLVGGVAWANAAAAVRDSKAVSSLVVWVMDGFLA